MSYVGGVGADKAFEEVSGLIGAIHHCSAIATNRFGILPGGEVVSK